MEHREINPDGERLATLTELKTLIAELGLQQSPELSNAYQRAISAHTEQNASEMFAALSHYQELASEEVITTENIETSRAANLAHNITTAMLWYECGDLERYAQALEDCCNEAFGLNYATIALQLEEMLERI